MKAYFYCTDGASVSGPVSIDELIRLRFSGNIGDMTQICEQGSEVWMPLATILLAHRQQEHAIKLASPVYATAANRTVQQSSSKNIGPILFGAVGVIVLILAGFLYFSSIRMHNLKSDYDSLQISYSAIKEINLESLNDKNIYQEMDAVILRVKKAANTMGSVMKTTEGKKLRGLLKEQITDISDYLIVMNSLFIKTKGKTHEEMNKILPDIYAEGKIVSERLAVHIAETEQQMNLMRQKLEK